MAQTLVSSDFEVTLMTPEMYAAHWTQISRELDTIEHLWRPWYTKEFFRLAPYNGVQVWNSGPPGEFRIVLYTQVYQYVSTTVLQLILCFGRDIDKAIPILEAMMERVAHSYDCQEIEIIGREGWARKLRGARKVATVFRRPVTKYGVQ